MNTPILSIITTIYNCEKYLKESLDSIFSQSFQDFELILVNDGSTDKTSDIAREFTDKNIKKVVYIGYSENKKIPIRRNQGIEYAARGKYIAVVDGDDISLPNRFEEQVSFLERNKHIFCVGGHAFRIDEKGEDLNIDNNNIMNYPPEMHHQILDMIIKKCANPIMDPTSMFRREDFMELGGYTLNNDIYLVMDFHLWLRSIVAGKKFYKFQKPLIKYRVREGSNTVKHKKEMIKQHMIVWRDFRKKIINKDFMYKN